MSFLFIQKTVLNNGLKYLIVFYFPDGFKKVIIFMFI